MIARFGAIGPTLHRGGWDIIPIRAKSKSPEIKGWQHGITLDQAEALAANGYASGSVGLLAKQFPAVDIDVLDQTCANTIELAALSILGAAPIRYGTAPKRLLVYHTDQPFKKIKVFLTAPDGRTKGPDGKEFAIEFLGDGQQFLIYGEHPDGFEYRWPDNDGPLDNEVWQLTTIGKEDILRFIDELPQWLPAGWVISKKAGSTSVAKTSLAAFDTFKPPLEDWDADRVMYEIAPHLDIESDYDDWLATGMALHHQFAGSFEGFELWNTIYESSSKYTDRSYGEAKWDSFSKQRAQGGGPVTLATLIKRVKPQREAKAEAQRGALVAELRDEIAAVTEARDLETRVAVKIAKNAELTDVDRGQLAGAIQKRLRELGSRIPLGDIRRWLIHRVHSGFVHVTEEGYPLCTIENLRVLLRRLGIRVRYNVIKKGIEILIPDHGFTRDNRDNAAIAYVFSECEKVRMPTKHVHQFLISLADANPYNPVMTWVESNPWDGVSRLEDFYATVVSSNALKKKLLRKWLLQAIAAAAAPDGIAAQGILTFVGPQNIGKTTWFKRLAPEALDLIHTGHTLDLRSKDSILISLSYWLVELGEVDATFRKSDISALKSFSTQSLDKYRRPYAATESSYPRRTVYGASVNDVQFLSDPTGNRRFWTIEASGFDLNHDIDMQQLWAEVWELHQAGEDFFLTQGDVAELNAHNQDFTIAHPVEELIADSFAWPVVGTAVAWEWVTARAALVKAGMREPKMSDMQAAGRALRRFNGNQVRKSNGKLVFQVPGSPLDFLG